jgi:hypothetical protein
LPCRRGQDDHAFGQGPERHPILNAAARRENAGIEGTMKRSWNGRGHTAGLKNRPTPTFRAYRSRQTNLRGRLKNLGIKHPPSLETMLGCSWAFFVQHIEEQFTDEMSWPAYGETWELHHCRPVNDFDFRRNKADVYLVNHWPNLGPLPRLENLSRGDAIQADDIRQLEANLAKARRLGMTGRIPRKPTCRALPMANMA